MATARLDRLIRDGARMKDLGSITLLLHNLRNGDEAPLVELHQRCWPWIVKRARHRLRGVAMRSIDEEDVAQEAFWGFVKSVRAGRTPKLESRHDLFALLTHIVACKAASQFERQMTKKRGRGQVRGESALDARGDASATGGLAAIPASDPTPEQEATLADCYDRYVSHLPNALRRVAELHVAGATYREIADQLGCVPRTVERKMALIRQRWQNAASTQ